MNRSKKAIKTGIAVTAVDLFCGAGGLTRGLLDSGVSVAAGYDIDEKCRFAYEHNNKGTAFHKKSISEVTGKELAAHYPESHKRILAGCAPCQPFSKYTQGADTKKDAKWGLLHEFGRLVEELQPDIVSMENVPELQRHSVFDDFLTILTGQGFYFTTDAQERVVYCPDYGIPQHRQRIVLLASKLGPIDLIAPTCKREKYPTVRTAIEKLQPLRAGTSSSKDRLHRTSILHPINRRRIEHSTPGGTWRDWPEELIADCHRSESGYTYPSVYGRMEWDKPSPTITTQFFGYGNGRFGHPQQNRALSLREGALLQSFPKDYEFVADEDEYCFKTIGRLIGNAVPVRLGEVVGLSILNHLKDYAEQS